MTIWKLYQGDCREILKDLPDNSIDSVVTDPPYGLSKEPDIREVLTRWLNGEEYDHGHKGFMGKSWDSFVPHPDIWREVFRVLKPGGHALVFSSTRTQDLTAISLRLAGFEVRDQIQWLYGTGMPKSYNVTKGIEGKLLHGNANTVNYRKLNKKNQRTQSMGYCDMHLKHGDRPKSYALGGVFDLDATTSEARYWDGWGTGLKPANEPIILCRKPISEKTIADNVLKWGTGAINIDGCRIGTDTIKTNGKRNGTGTSLEWSKYKSPDNYAGTKHVGRFPANVTLDEEAAVLLDQQSGVSKSTGGSGPKSRGALGKNIYGEYALNVKAANAGGLGDSGGASRFFYCAKASKHDRAGSKHPTVKPIKLVRYLCRLITPPNGTILDPFAGSGTTLQSAVEEGFSVIGVELEDEYCDDIRRRMGEPIEDMFIAQIPQDQPLQMSFL